ncbi:MAG: transposase [Alphaproteobacteria bacterium]|jgi:transposase|nr:transposase [Alphaproteobacteria bacterium]
MTKKRTAAANGAGWSSGFVGRLEVHADRSGRRNWPPEAKGRLVRESLAPGATVSGVARRHGLMPQQLTRWRRLARQGRLALPEAPETAGAADAGAFAALVVAEDPPPEPATAAERSIELVVGTVVVRLPATTPAVRLAEIAAALEVRR